MVMNIHVDKYESVCTWLLWSVHMVKIVFISTCVTKIKEDKSKGT